MDSFAAFLGFTLLRAVSKSLTWVPQLSNGSWQSSVRERGAHWKLLWERGRECQEKPIPVLRALRQCQGASEVALAGTHGSWEGTMQRCAGGIFSPGVQGFWLAGYQFYSMWNIITSYHQVWRWDIEGAPPFECFALDPHHPIETRLQRDLVLQAALLETLWEHDPFTTPLGQYREHARSSKSKIAIRSPLHPVCISN